MVLAEPGLKGRVYVGKPVLGVNQPENVRLSCGNTKCAALIPDMLNKSC